MGVMFFQNGSALGTDAGWGGFTGSNNYVVRYDFRTGAEGASQLAIVLNNIFYGHGAASQSFGFMVSPNPTEYSNVRAVPPVSNTASMTYASPTGYGCTLWAQGLNLLPNSVYYIYVYIVSSGAEYYTGWNCVAPQIVTGGSYTPPQSSISTLSTEVMTGGTLSLIMNRSGTNYHRASFSSGGSTLALSEAFASALSFTCPRSWFNSYPTAGSIEVDVSVQSYSDPSCSVPVGSPVQAGFTLTADRDMRPALSAQAISVSAVNSNLLLSHLVSGISKARVTVDTAGVDMSACAGAEPVKYTLNCQGKIQENCSGSFLTDVLSGESELTVTVVDSRGRDGSAKLTVSPAPYVPPSLTELAAVRCTSDGTVQEDGAYLKVKCTALCSAISGNSCSVKVQAEQNGTSVGAAVNLTGLENGVWSDEWDTPLILGGTISGDGWRLRFSVSDTAGGSRNYVLPLQRTRWAMKFSSDGTAVGFGMAPDMPNALQIPDNWRLCLGIPVLSSFAYGTQAPENAVSSPVEGQIYLRLTT